MPDITSFDGVSASQRTAAQVLAIIEKIDLAIYNLLATDKNAGVTYRVGDRVIDRDGYLLWLLDARKTYERQLAALPSWETSVYDDPHV
jgi:hypothetical protein